MTRHPIVVNDVDVVGLLSLACALAAAQTFWSTPALLKDFFKGSERVTYVELSAEEVTAAVGRAHEKVTVYVGRTQERVDGFAVVENEKGQHQPITFGVQVTPDGKIARAEIMAYREAYGGEIRDPRFLKQLVGKTLGDPIKLNADVDGISGATISSRSAIVVARRALILCELAKKKLEASP